MFPTLSLGPLAVPSFTALMLLAFAVGGYLGTRQARQLGYEAEVVWDMLPWAAAAGVVGAKLYYLIGIAGGLGPDQSAAALLPALLGSGMVWYGGAVAGVAAAAWRIRRAGVPFHQLLDYGAPCLAAGHAIGRIGCFAVGDDWGLPTDVPWAVTFPDGAPPSTAASLRNFGVEIPEAIPDAQLFAVHPTQLYEAAGLAFLAAALWRLTRGRPRPWSVFALYLLGYGVLRLAVEFLRAKDDRLAMGLTVAQLISLACIAAGTGLWMQHRAPRTSLTPVR